MKQELSYRKQVARKLCTQYVEGIHMPKYYTVTLKSRLRVTQGHWKRKKFEDVFIHFHKIPACNGGTDRQMDILRQHIVHAMHSIVR